MPEPVGSTGPTVSAGAVVPPSPAPAAPAAAPTPAPAPAAPATPPAAPPAPTPEPSGSGNEENKFRRLHEAAVAKQSAAEARVAELEAAETKRKQGEMSEIDRANALAAEANTKAAAAEARAAEIERKQLVDAIAIEHGLTAEARKLLNGADEAALRENAAAIAAVMKQPAIAGTPSQPGRTGGASLDDQISQSFKSNSPVKTIELLRAKASRNQ